MCWMPGNVEGNSASEWWIVFTRNSGASPIQSDTRAFITVVQNFSSRTGLLVRRPMWLNSVMPASRVGW